MTWRKRVGLGVVLLAVLINHSASYAEDERSQGIKNDEQNAYTLTHEGYVYTYDRVPVFKDSTEKIDYYDGLVTIKNSKGIVEISYGGIAEPGCGDLPAISLIQIRSSIASLVEKPEIFSQYYIVFCGSHKGDGRERGQLRLFHSYNDPASYANNTNPVRFYGFVATLFFENGPVNFTENETGDFTAIKYHNYKTPAGDISYPIFRTLSVDSNIENIYFSAAITDSARSFYRSVIKDNKRRFEESKDAVFLVKLMIAATLIGDTDNYCESLSIMNDKNERDAKSAATQIIGYLRNKFRINCEWG